MPQCRNNCLQSSFTTFYFDKISEIVDRNQLNSIAAVSITKCGLTDVE